MTGFVLDVLGSAEPAPTNARKLAESGSPPAPPPVIKVATQKVWIGYSQNLQQIKNNNKKQKRKNNNKKQKRVIRVLRSWFMPVGLSAALSSGRCASVEAGFMMHRAASAKRRRRGADHGQDARARAKMHEIRENGPQKRRKVLGAFFSRKRRVDRMCTYVLTPHILSQDHFGLT